MDATAPTARKSPRFRLIFLSLCITLFLSALELTSVSTALPTIASALNSTEFVWIGSAYAVASTAFLPLSSDVAEIFGRRPALLVSVGLFALGSAICGAAQNMKMMISGRTVQGLGSGGIQSLSMIILADLVSLEDRAIYASLFGVTWSISSLIGPVIGGALASKGAWRWLFYLNLPIAAVAVIIILTCMKLPTPSGTFYQKLKQIDWIGNLLIVGGTTSCTIGLVWGGIQAPWSSSRILVPLIVGFVAFVTFFFYEAKYAPKPIMPFILFSNRTSLSGYLQTFLVAVVAVSFGFYLPAYFQACKGASPLRSGVLALGGSALAPSAIVAGVLVKRTSRYRPQMWTGWVLILIGLGLLLLVDESTGLGSVIGFTVILGVGIGHYSTTVFPIQAPLPVTSNASALALLMFVRSFASVWGFTIGSTVLQNHLTQDLSNQGLDAFLSRFPQGVSVAYSIIPIISDLPEPLKSTVRAAFADSLRVLWITLLGIGALGMVSSFFMKGLALPDYTDRKWGMDQELKEKESAEPKRSSAPE
ncbi:MFS general substrate transporter [Mycena floridula]|nr:MFS general substrate transporter [Mycena floridula]